MGLKTNFFWSYLIFALSLVLSIALHWKVFNKDITGIHTWRQAQTSLNIRYFYREDPNILNTRVAHFNGGKDNLYHYEFPLMQWSIAMLQHVFGEHVVVTRISVFIIGLLTLTAFSLLLFSLYKDPLIAALGFWALSFSPVFFYYTVNPLPDNLALCAGMFYLYFAIKNYRKESLINHLAAAFFISLATLSKLPFIVFGAVTFVYFLQKWSAEKFRISKGLVLNASIYLIMLLPAFFWYRWVMPGWVGNGILHGIFANDNSWANVIRILSYHVRIMFPKILLNPVSLILILSAMIYFFKNRDFSKKQNIGLLAAFIMGMLYFGLEINMIDTVHDYYMMPFLPFLYLAVMYGTKGSMDANPYLKLPIIPVFLLMPYQNLRQNRDSWSYEKSGVNKNLFIHKKALQQAVPKGERVIVLNDLSQFNFFYIIDKEGYVFKDDYLQAEWVDDLVWNFNVKYMYSDSRKVDENPEMQKRIDTVLLQAGSIKVLRLKKYAK